MDSTAIDPPVDVETLVGAVRAGRTEAFADLVRLHHRVVRGYLARLLRDAHAADDIAQEVFLEAYRKLADYSGAGSFAGWLIGIARHKALSHLRRVTRREGLFASHVDRWLQEQRERELAAESFDAELAARRLDSLAACLDELAPAARRLIDACYFEGRTAESLAEEWRRSPGALRTTLWRIRRSLADCLRGKLGDTENDA